MTCVGLIQPSLNFPVQLLYSLYGFFNILIHILLKKDIFIHINIPDYPVVKYINLFNYNKIK